MDVLVAEKVMGWHRHLLVGYHQWCETVNGELRPLHVCEPDYHVSPWKPSRTLDHAWQVIEKLWPEFSWTITDDVPPTVCAAFWQGDHEWRAVGQSAPHAICLAALMAVGYKGPGTD